MCSNESYILFYYYLCRLKSSSERKATTLTTTSSSSSSSHETQRRDAPRWLEESRGIAHKSNDASKKKKNNNNNRDRKHPSTRTMSFRRKKSRERRTTPFFKSTSADDEETTTVVGVHSNDISRTQLLNDGNIIPTLGLGTWKSNPPEACTLAIAAALRNGLTHLDCASAYANEHVIGKCLRDVFTNEDTSREDVFITSKLWNDRRKPEDVERRWNKR